MSRTTQVHLPRTVGEHPKGEHPLDEPARARRVVTALRAHEGEDAGADLADRAAVDRHARFDDPLEERDHR